MSIFGCLFDGNQNHDKCKDILGILKWLVSFQCTFSKIRQNMHFQPHILHLGADRPWTNIMASILTIGAAVPWDNRPCLCIVVLLFTLTIQRQNVHFSISGVVVAYRPLYQKAKQKCVVMVMYRISHSAATRVMLLSWSLQLSVQTQGTFVNLKGELTNWAVLGLELKSSQAAIILSLFFPFRGEPYSAPRIVTH